MIRLASSATPQKETFIITLRQLLFGTVEYGFYPTSYRHQGQ